MPLLFTERPVSSTDSHGSGGTEGLKVGALGCPSPVSYAPCHIAWTKPECESNNGRTCHCLPKIPGLRTQPFFVWKLRQSRGWRREFWYHSVFPEKWVFRTIIDP